MSALARVFWQQGRPLQGSNIESNARTNELNQLGIPVSLGHDAKHLGDASAVVYSSAISQNNIEMKTAKRQGLDILHRQEVLAKLTGTYPTIGIAGTHGKTTTAVLIATLLKEAGCDPSYLLGAGCPRLNGHSYWGSDDALVLEVDESDGHFLKFHPALAVITNIGIDHLNHYKDESAILSSFRQYVAQSDQAILCADDKNCQRLLNESSDALSYGLNPKADLVADCIVQDQFKTHFQLTFRGKSLGEVQVPLPGIHNVYNTLAALLSGWHWGLSFADMLPLVRQFQLPEHRFDVLNQNGVMIVDDYAHLPEQIDINLKTIRANWKKGRVIALFQPHRFSRMQYMGERFGPAFVDADIVGVTDIYPAFEKPVPGVDVNKIVDEVAMHAPEVHYLPNSSVVDFMKRVVRPGDAVIGFGAGDLCESLYQFVSPSVAASH